MQRALSQSQDAGGVKFFGALPSARACTSVRVGRVLV